MTCIKIFMTGKEIHDIALKNLGKSVTVYYKDQKMTGKFSLYAIKLHLSAISNIWEFGDWEMNVLLDGDSISKIEVAGQP